LFFWLADLLRQVLVVATVEAGTVWYLRLSDPHRVFNGGSADRVHMVIDANVNGWVEALFETASS